MWRLEATDRTCAYLQMNRTAVKSSNIRSIGYNRADKILEVEFHSGDIFQYSEVPEFEYRGLMSAESHGRYFDRNIKKGAYRYVRVGETPPTNKAPIHFNRRFIDERGRPVDGKGNLLYPEPKEIDIEGRKKSFDCSTVPFLGCTTNCTTRLFVSFE